MRSKTNPRQKKPAVFSQNILGIISNEQDYILHVQVSNCHEVFPWHEIMDIAIRSEKAFAIDTQIWQLF
jgi:tetrahydromethanopterin S-methyltransferase subunit H